MAVNLLRAEPAWWLLSLLTMQSRPLNTASLRELSPPFSNVGGLEDEPRFRLLSLADFIIFPAGENCGDADGCATLHAGELWRSDRDGRGVIVC